MYSRKTEIRENDKKEKRKKSKEFDTAAQREVIFRERQRELEIGSLTPCVLIELYVRYVYGCKI